MKKVFPLATVLFLLALTVQYAFAQDVRPTPTNTANASTQTDEEGRGSIRGTVYEDANADGKCSSGDKILAGVPIRFQSGSTSLYLQSGDNGTYGLVAAAYGFWQVAAEPTKEFAVTSEKVRNVTLDTTHIVVTGIDFCVAAASAVKTGGGSSTLLPEAGAPIAPMLLWIAGIGLVLLGTGIGLERKRRQTV